MTSKITLHSANIDGAYPIAGINQSSQGFRDNFSAIKTALSTGAGEITNLQAKQVLVTGDVTGSTAPFGENGSPVGLSLVLGNVLSSPGAYSTATHDLSLTFDAKGRLTAVTATPTASDIDAGVEYGPSSTYMGTGTGTIDFPTFTFDASGKAVDAGTATVSYGLLGHTLERGQLVAGDNTDLSAVVPVPPAFDGSYFLVASGNGATGLEWTSLDAAGGVTSVTAGAGISVSGTNDRVVSLDIAALSGGVTIADGDLFALYSTSTTDVRRVSFNDVRAAIGQTALSELADDRSPELGGNLNLRTYAIGSSEPNGVVIDGTTGITIGDMVWPTADGSAGQFLTTDGAGQLAWAGKINPAYVRTLFVSSDSGDDVNSSGGIDTPYQTISQAIANVVPTEDWTIVLLGGEYAEDITLTGVVAQHLTLLGHPGFIKPKFTGLMTVDSGVVQINATNVAFDRSSYDVVDTQPAIDIISGIGELHFNNCDLFRGSGEKTALRIFQVQGEVTAITFENCAFQGNLDLAAIGSDHQITINNTRQIGDMSFSITTYSNLLVSNTPQIKGIIHNDGNLVLENVGQLLDQTMTVAIPGAPVWEVNGSEPVHTLPITSVPLTPVLSANGRPIQATNAGGQPLFESDGVTPKYKMTDKQQAFTVTTSDEVKGVALYSVSSSGQVILRNVNLFKDGSFATIVKTGMDPWLFDNVMHRAEQNIIKGPRITTKSTVDDGEFVQKLTASGDELTYVDSREVFADKINPDVSKFYHILLEDNATVVIATPDAITTDNETVIEMTVLVEQDSTGSRSLVWGADGGPGISWTGGSTPAPDANALTVYRFYYFGASRKWIGTKDSEGGSAAGGLVVQNISNNLYSPSLSDAGKYLRIADNSRATFEIPTQSTVAFPIGTQIHILQAGQGKVLIGTAAGVTINSPEGLSSRRPYSLITLTKVGANVWDLSGEVDLAMYRADSTAITADDDTFTVDTI